MFGRRVVNQHRYCKWGKVLFTFNCGFVRNLWHLTVVYSVADDVGGIANAMGTPGDRFPVGEIVLGESAIENAHGDVADQPDQPDALDDPTEMTVLRDIPSLGIFLEHGLDQPQGLPDKDVEKALIPSLDELEKQLLYDSGKLQPLLYGSDVNKPALTHVMQELSLPGPSGLQTPKACKQPASAAAKIAPKRSRKPPVGSATPKKPHACSICNKNFQNVSKLVSHQVTHSGGTPFKCDHCKKSFSSKFKLVRHVLIHSDRKPFSCTVCERTFHRKDHLKNHIKVHSPSKKVYTCEKANCKKEYTSVMSYRKHLALHSAEEGGLECKICLKTFETKPDILYHLKIHAGSRTVKNPNEKKFTCDYCDRKFFTRKDVRRHLVVHTGTRNFLCQFCPQRFGRKDHLVRHIKKSHSTTYSEPESADATSQPAIESIKQEQELPIDAVEIDPKIEIPPVENILYPTQYAELPPMLCSAPDTLYLPSDSKLELLPETRLPADELLTELVVLKEEYELAAHETSTETDLLPHDLPDLHNLHADIDTDILRLISEGNAQLTADDENNLPLPGFSQAFQQPP